MSFNTAIFFDIENLLRGYDFTPREVAGLRLTDILSAIRQTQRIGQVAVQRAYANWADPRLAIMRTEINELGIDPIQVFGFAKDQKKNAADIQLAIDAIDLAHVRPALEVFVIVSGDGGFTALARKLHEYGKTVIGCAYGTTTSRTFQAVCDAYVCIPQAASKERVVERAVVQKAPRASVVSDPRNVRLSAKVKPCPSLEPALVLAKIQEVLNWFASDPSCAQELAQGGIFLTVVHEAARYAVPGYKASQFGFAKFSEYLQYACKGSPLCVGRQPHRQAVVMRRKAVPEGTQVFPDLDSRDLHSEDGYRALLSQGGTLLRIPPPSELQFILHRLCTDPPQGSNLKSLIEALVLHSNGALSADLAKHGLLSLVAAEAFERHPEEAALAGQKLTLPPDLRTPEALLAVLREAVITKLTRNLADVRDDLLDKILSLPKGPSVAQASSL